MNRHLAIGPLAVSLVVLSLIAGCARASSPTSTTVAPTPTGTGSVASPAPTVVVTATPTPRPTAKVVVTSNIAYESMNPVGDPGVLDVYAPVDGGPWPVVAMLHPPGLDKGWLGEHAQKVAALGFVVFVPTWGAGGNETEPTYDGLMAVDSQAGCAVAFAGAHANKFGGNSATMIVFGHSGGANIAAMVTFARPEPSPGCLAGAVVGPIDALVTWEGDWLAYDPRFIWDRLLAADPRIMDGYTPWKYIAEDEDLKVVMLLSQNPGIPVRPLSDPPAPDSWLAARDPSGDLFRQLKTNGALTDGSVDVADLQQLLFSVLHAQGNPVSLDVMPDSTHEYIRGDGWPVFLGAFEKALAE